MEMKVEEQHWITQPRIHAILCFVYRKRTKTFFNKGMYKKVYNTTPGFCGINEIKQSDIYATVNDNVA